MSEYAEPDLGKYETFTKFFTRILKPGARTIDEPENTKSMCSPCDGRVLSCGKINSEYSTIDCVKGRSYRLDEFMLGYIGNPEDDDNMDKNIAPNNRSVAALIDKVK
jgi:phosphatidylserine decarboxylase precursor